MDPLLHIAAGLLTDLHDEIKTQIVDLGQEALDWSPGEEMNSLAVLVAHTAGAEKFWIREIVMQTSIGRDRDQEFATIGVNAKALGRLLDDSLSDIHAAFDELTGTDLSEPRRRSPPRAEVTVGWAVVHTVRHTALHLGHMEITRQLVESRQTT